MKFLKQFLKGGFFLVACMMVFWFLNSVSSAALLSDSECQSQGGVCETNNPTCTGKKRIDGCAFANDGQVRTCCGKADADEESENKDVQCAKTHKGTCFHQNQTKDVCTVKGMELKGECESENGAEMMCCFDSKNPNNAYSSSTTSSGTAATLNYTPLENLPGFEGQGGDFATYFKNLYLLALWIVGISALFMLVVGGFLYLSSAGNTSLLGYAKKTIYGALIGLVIALISWLLLDTINSDLTNLKLSGLSGVFGGNSGTSTATTPPSGDADPEGCKKLKNLSVDQSQCNLASKELVQMLSCMEGKGIGNKWTSISANAVGGDQNKAAACCGASKEGSCPHSDVSCHHGCTYGTKGLSYAVDIGGTSGASDATLCAIASAAKSCGGGNVWGPRTLSCGIKAQDGHNSHLHVSVSGCPH